MKTTRLTYLLLPAITAFALAFASCQKEDIKDESNDNKSLQTLVVDENEIQQIDDESMRDVESVIGGAPGGLKSATFLPCNATIDSASVQNDTITFYITYNGLNCNETRFRTGKVEISKKIGTHWKEEGASVIIRFIDLKITRVSTGKSITLNGVKTRTNVTGGLLWMLGNTMTSIVHKDYGYVNATFDDSTTKVWNLALQRTFTGTPGQLVTTVDGFGQANDYQNLVSWGVNRDGEEFFTSIEQSVVHKQLCNFDPVSGIKVHRIPADDKSATITFGYDANGQPVTGEVCPTHYRLDWQHGSNTGTLYLPLR